MSVAFEPYKEGVPPFAPDGCDAFIRVRIVSAQRPDGNRLVYLSNGTGIVVPSRYLLCGNRDPSASAEDEVDHDHKDPVAHDSRRVSQ